MRSLWISEIVCSFRDSIKKIPLYSTCVPLDDDLTDLSHDVIIKLDEAGGAAPDVGVIEVLGAGVKSLQVLVTEVHHHHLLVEGLDSETEVEVVHTAILLQVLQERVDEVSVL